jgi:hypothetical protein
MPSATLEAVPGRRMPDRFLVHDQAVANGATHAVVIGVGHYPHLPGGGSPVQIENPEGLTQLTSPPVSAREISTWLIQRYNHPDRPLASLALLISGGPKRFANPVTGEDHAVEPATIDNIEAALTDWRARGQARPDQRLIFYFCGHGVANGTAATLLASDYGEKPFNALDGAVDFPMFRQAMAISTASEQIYIVDACRVASPTLLRAGNSGRPIFQGDKLAPANPNLLAPTFYSTLPGVSAYGRRGEPSFFTEALKFGLDGAGAVRTGRGWKITTLRLQEALDFYLERALKEVGRTGTPPTDQQVAMDLQWPTAEPKGMALVTVDPAVASRSATLMYVDVARNETVRQGKAKKGEWILELAPGMYRFQAEFARGPWHSELAEAYIQPVSLDVSIKATR